MYKHHKIIASLIFLLIFAVSFASDVRLTNEIIGHLITFFSIVFGFYLTGLSILFGSSYSKRLRNEEDPRLKTQTKLHTLKSYFNYSSVTSLGSIVLLLITSLLGLDKQATPCETKFFEAFSLCREQLFTSVSLGLAAVNIMFMFLLFRVFFNGFMEEGSSE